MNKKPLISIITPTYNHENFIGKCIDSVISQDYPIWEQIIIDDGSTDSTERIITEYKDDRIKYFKQENKGIWNLYKNYNKALENAKGDLIAILEGDDFWPNNKLSKQIMAFEDPDVVLSWGNVYIVNKTGNVIKKPAPRNNFKSDKSIPKILILKQLLFGNFIPACTVMCRKDALIKIGGFKQPENSPSVDHATWLHLSMEGKFHYLNELLGFWRIHEKQITQNKNLEMRAANWKYCASFYENLSPKKRDKIGIKIDEITHKKEESLSRAYFHQGRVGLYEKEWEISKKNFIIAYKKGNYLLKIQSILGIIFSHMKLNFEMIVRILNIPQIKDLY